MTPVVPTAEDAETIDVQGKTQTAKPKFTGGDSDVPMDDSVPATFEDGSTTKVIPGVGIFTVSPDGTITFVPEPGFTGVAPTVTIKRVDVNGTVVTANYTATVTPAPVEPDQPTPPAPSEPEQPATPAPAKPEQPELPNTGTQESMTLGLASVASLFGFFLLAFGKKKEEDQ
ncbi:CshA protein [Streptococcus sp. DD13]|nr:CshA protein [Streptococcus sp. DD13]